VQNTAVLVPMGREARSSPAKPPMNFLTRRGQYP
jgi:hypothetical protein